MTQPVAIDLVLKDLAGRARLADSPTPAQLERMSAALAAMPHSWAPPPAGGSTGEVAVPSSTHFSPWLGSFVGKWIAASSIALIGAALVAGGLRGEAREERAASVPAASAPVVTPLAEAMAAPYKQNERPAISNTVSRAPESASVPRPEDPDVSALVGGRRPGGPASGKIAGRPRPMPTSPESRNPEQPAGEQADVALRAELAQMELIESALRRNQPDEALILGASFKFEQLRHQATALQAIALCKSHRRKQGARLAKNLLFRNGNSPFLRRITQACAE